MTLSSATRMMKTGGTPSPFSVNRYLQRKMCVYLFYSFIYLFVCLFVYLFAVRANLHHDGISLRQVFDEPPVEARQLRLVAAEENALRHHNQRRVQAAVVDIRGDHKQH